MSGILGSPCPPRTSKSSAGWSRHFNDRDLDALAQYMEADAELLSAASPARGKGLPGTSRACARCSPTSTRTGSTFRWSRGFRDAGDEVVLLGRLQGRGRASGVDLDVPMGFVWTLREGKVVYARSILRAGRRAAGRGPRVGPPPKPGDA